MEGKIPQIVNDLDQQVVGRIGGKDVTRAQFSAAFEKVRPAGNWKGRINATVDLDVEEVDLVHDAVIFFTGSVPEFIEVAKLPNGKGRYHVRAAGYYVAVGA